MKNIVKTMEFYIFFCCCLIYCCRFPTDVFAEIDESVLVIVSCVRFVAVLPYKLNSTQTSLLFSQGGYRGILQVVFLG